MNANFKKLIDKQNKKDKFDLWIEDVSIGLPKEQKEANLEWAELAKRMVKPGGTIVTSGGIFKR
jgi:hypothetical protein